MCSFYACTDANPVSVDSTDIDVRVLASSVAVNRGNGQPSATDPCNFGSYLTTDVTNVRTPGGAQLLTCKFRGLPPVQRVVQVKGYECFLPGGAITFDSFWRHTPAGTGTVTCTYRAP
jgi:hypothetical protein